MGDPRSAPRTRPGRFSPPCRPDFTSRNCLDCDLLGEQSRKGLPDELLGTASEEVGGEAVHGLEKPLVVHREDEILRTLDQGSVFLLRFLELLRPLFDPSLQDLAPPPLEIEQGAGAYEDHHDDEPLQKEKPDVCPLDRVLDFRVGGDHRDRPLDPGCFRNEHGAVGDQLFDPARDPPVPPGIIDPCAGLAFEHLLLLYEEDACGVHGRELFLPDLECVLPDEIAVRVIKKIALTVHEPGIARFPRTDVPEKRG